MPDAQNQSVEATKNLESTSLLDSIIEKTNISIQDETYDITKKGVSAFITELLKPHNRDQSVKKLLVDKMLAEVDQKISGQMDQIMHNEEFQKVESSWRGLKLLVDRTDFRENIKIEILNASKEELLDDFEDAPEITQTGLYKHIYTAEYGQFGGEPVGLVVGNYNFSPSAPDIKFLQNMAAISAMSHAPFISAAGPQFFGLDNFEGLPDLKDLSDHFESPLYSKWQSFREQEDSRFVGLTLPRFLLRQPYDPSENPVKSFNYREDIEESHENYLWGNTAFTMASNIAESFAKYRWGVNIVGPQSGGTVSDLPLHHFENMGGIETKIPTEVLVSDRREYELAEEGFISLSMRKGSDNAAFFSANSVQKPKYFGNSEEGKMAEMNYRLGTQLPYLFIVSRLAHYIKVLQREQIGSWKERSDIEDELNKWIRQYVADQENAPAEVRSRRPLRSASIQVEEVEGNAGWYRVGLSIRPHFKYMGADFTLSLVGKLDKE